MCGCANRRNSTVDRAARADGRPPGALGRLEELGLNLRWTWDRETRALFREIYPGLWDQIEDNPRLVLRGTSPARLAELAANAEFRARLDREHAELQAYMAAP